MWTRYMSEPFEKTFAEFFAGIGLMRIGPEPGGVSAFHEGNDRRDALN